MLSRIYWLLPDLESARRTMNDLLLARIGYRQMHFVARDDANMAGLHAANVLQTSDLVPSAERGLVIGAALGASLGALAAVFYPIVGDEPQWALAAALALAGGLFGAWTSSMIGVSTPSKRLARFAPQIEQGQILLMVDVPIASVEAVETRLQALHPEAHLEGSEPRVPAFS